jgi:hypothetical protein
MNIGTVDRVTRTIDTDDSHDDGSSSRTPSTKRALSKPVRLSIVILALALVVFGIPVGLRVIGERQVGREAARIRAVSATTHADMSQLSASMYDARASNPVATSLGVGSSQVQVRKESSGWCAQVSVRRLISERNVFLAVSRDGVLTPVNTCR